MRGSAPNDQTNIRGLDPVLYREVRAEAVRRGETVGETLNAILYEWVRARQPELLVAVS